MLSQGTAQERLTYAFGLYANEDQLLSLQGLRSMLTAMSLPPRDVRVMRLVESEVLQRTNPTRTAGATLATRRAYARTRHIKPRDVDQVANISLADLTSALHQATRAALEEHGTFARWVDEQAAAFRAKLGGRQHADFHGFERMEVRQQALLQQDDEGLWSLQPPEVHPAPTSEAPPPASHDTWRKKKAAGQKPVYRVCLPNDSHETPLARGLAHHDAYAEL